MVHPRSWSKISNVTQHDVAGTLSEFFDCYRNESGVNGASRVYLERALDKAVGRKLAKTMLDDIYGGAMNDDLRRLEWIPPELIVRFLEQEHVQMQALFLAFLPPEQASAIIVLFPESKHDDLLYRIASLREVSEHVIDDVRLTLESHRFKAPFLNHAFYWGKAMDKAQPFAELFYVMFMAYLSLFLSAFISATL